MTGEKKIPTPLSLMPEEGQHDATQPNMIPPNPMSRDNQHGHYRTQCAMSPRPGAPRCSRRTAQVLGHAATDRLDVQQQIGGACVKQQA
eukprot:352888-Chlamydomonas_euryale.AAC.6